MTVMAITTGGRVHFPGSQRQAVHTGTIALGLLPMTTSAVRRARGYIVVGVLFCKVAVTTRASIGLMNGAGEFDLINKKGNGFAG